MKDSTPRKGGGGESEKGGGGTQLKTDGPTFEQLETLAKTNENYKFLEGGTPKRKIASNLTRSLESPAKERKILIKEFNFENLRTFWTGNLKTKPSDVITEKNILGDMIIAKPSHSLKLSAE